MALRIQQAEEPDNRRSRDDRLTLLLVVHVNDELTKGGIEVPVEVASCMPHNDTGQMWGC